MAERIDPRFLGDKNRQAHQDALVVRARMLDADSVELTPEQRADEVLKYSSTRAMLRPPPDAPHGTWVSYLSTYPSPVAQMDGDEGPLHTHAEVSLGQVLDALPDDSPWLARLERADEDFGRPLGDGLRVSRWCAVLVDMHYADVEPPERSEIVHRLSDAVWCAYRRYLETWRAT